MRRFKQRRDDNQAEIVRDLLYLGVSVQEVDQGGGTPDLLLGWEGLNHLVETKRLKGKLNKRQEQWHEKWRGRVIVARTTLEILHQLELTALIQRYHEWKGTTWESTSSS